VLIKTQRDDKVGRVCASQPAGLSFKIVIIGKSVIHVLIEKWGSLSRKARATQIVSRSGKVSLRSIFLSVPQTDTGALVENTKASGRQWFKELGNKN
jgi:hypothetical protein